MIWYAFEESETGVLGWDWTEHSMLVDETQADPEGLHIFSGMYAKYRLGWAWIDITRGTVTLTKMKRLRTSTAVVAVSPAWKKQWGGYGIWMRCVCRRSAFPSAAGRRPSVHKGRLQQHNQLIQSLVRRRAHALARLRPLTVNGKLKNFTRRPCTNEPQPHVRHVRDRKAVCAGVRSRG